MSIKQQTYETLAKTLIKKFEARGFEGYYCNTKEEALSQALSLMKEGSTVTWGGSETLKEIGMFDALKEADYVLWDRATAKTPQEQKEFYAKSTLADYYLMSSNAITLDGQLVNVDGNGNRVACLITGPENVIVIASMNKVMPDVESAMARVRNFAAPPNVIRLNKDTGCKDFGKCVDCLKDDCICCHTVITRKSRVKNRIKVILVGEELGY